MLSHIAVTAPALATEEVSAGPGCFLFTPTLLADARYTFTDQFDICCVIIKIDCRKIADAMAVKESVFRRGCMYTDKLNTLAQ